MNVFQVIRLVYSTKDQKGSFSLKSKLINVQQILCPSDIGGVHVSLCNKRKIVTKEICFRFANGPCSSGTRNGTCYTEAECESRGGANSGTCAAGFGVCCISETKYFHTCKQTKMQFFSSNCWLWSFLERELHLFWQQQPRGRDMQYGDLSLWWQYMSGNSIFRYKIHLAHNMHFHPNQDSVGLQHLHYCRSLYSEYFSCQAHWENWSPQWH